MMTGYWLWVTCIRRKINGYRCWGYWDWKGQTCRCQGIYSSRWFRRFSDFGMRCGGLTPAWARWWGDSSTGWPTGWQGSNHDGYLMVDWSNPQLGNCYNRSYWRKWRIISRGGIIRACSILRLVRFLTSMRRRYRVHGRGFLKGGGNRIS